MKRERLVCKDFLLILQKETLPLTMTIGGNALSIRATVAELKISSGESKTSFTSLIKIPCQEIPYGIYMWNILPWEKVILSMINSVCRKR